MTSGNASETQLLHRTNTLPPWCPGEIRFCPAHIHRCRQNRQKLACQFGLILAITGLPHVQKLRATVGAIPEARIGKPHRVATDATQYAEMIVLAYLDVHHHRNLKASQLGTTSLDREANL